MNLTPSLSTPHASASPSQGFSRLLNGFLRLQRLRLAQAYWRTALAFSVPFFLYTITLAPTIYNLDSAELTTATVTGGLMRATGYPLYMFLGRFWALLPIGDVGFRMNLFSAFNGALTLLFVERILNHLKIGHFATLSALGLLAVAPFFWSLSLVAEVYTLHTALMGLLILLLLEWGDHPLPETLGVITLLLGLSLGHHLATTLLIPGAVWYVLVTHPRVALTPRGVLLSLAGGLVGLSIYLYLPLRYLSAPTFNYAGTYDATGMFNPVNLLTPTGLWWLITGKSFAAQMFAYQGLELWNEIVWFVGHLARAFFVVGIGPGLWGAGVLFRRNWKMAGMLTLMFVCTAVFYIDYRVLDKETMFLPTYVIWTIWIGIGTHTLLQWVRTSTPREVWPLRVVQVLVAIPVLASFILTGPQVDLSDDWSTRLRGEAILREVEPDALVLGWWDTVPVVQYLQLVEGQRPDVQAINRFLISYDDLTTLVKNEVQTRPVYINEMPLGWQDTFYAQKVGPVYRVYLRQD
ncbi:MAG: DUF2723 domain-containing protein [Anaerolineales bacterium]|nr:DUF2723 domain-containing protein [Anaerolineales bacterium]